MEEKKYCYKYPHPAVTADCIVFGFDRARVKVLLIQRGNEPFKGKWAFPGGFVNIDESAEQGALRELEEETGLRVERVEQVGAFSAPDRDPRERVITIAFYSFIELQDVKGGDDAAKAKWFDLGKLPPLAFDHVDILSATLNRLRERLDLDSQSLDLLPSKMTVEVLRHLLEAIK